MGISTLLAVTNVTIMPIRVTKVVNTRVKNIAIKREHTHTQKKRKAKVNADTMIQYLVS